VVIERWGSRLLQLGVFAVLTRLVAPDMFGVVALAMSVIAVLQVVVDSGFSKALVQLKTLDAKDASTAFWTSLALAAALYGGLFLSAPALAGLLGNESLAAVLQVLGLALPLGALSQTPVALLERELQFKILSLRQVFASLVGSLAAIAVAIAGGGIWALVTQAIATAAASFVALWASTAWRPGFVYSFASLKRLWPVGVSIMGTELLDALQGNIDKLVVGFAFSAEVLGYYYVAQRLGTILMELVTTVISRVSLTTFSRVQDDLPRLNRIFRQMTFAAGLIGIPVFGLCAVFAPQLFPLVFGPRWEPAIPILWGLAGGWALSAVMYFDRPVLLATGHAKSAFWLALLQNAAGITLLIALLPFGIVGVVISRWARVIVWPARLWVMRRAIELPIRPYVSQVLRVVAAFAPLAAILIGLQQTDWARGPWAFLAFTLPTGLASLVVYVALTWWLAGEENRASLRPLAIGVIRRLRRR
jgi:O-antigen/teichoic acid export membrane protein